jgi:hypothetical protein
MPSLWPCLERIAALLDLEERQSVLGDIQERGATLRALFELIGLVALRQLQAWRSWRPWALAAALYYPARSAGLHTHPVASVLYSGHLFSYETVFGTHIINPWDLMRAPIFAWATGFALGRLGGRGSASLLLLLPAVLAWDIYEMARSIFFFRRYVPEEVYTSLFKLQEVQAARLAFFETAAFFAALFLMFVLVAVPCLRGYRRGLHARPLSRLFPFMLLLLCVPVILQLFLIPIFGSVVNFSLWRWPMVAAPWWPVVYMLVTGRRVGRHQPAIPLFPLDKA